VVSVSVAQSGSSKKEAEIEVLAIGAKKRTSDGAVKSLAATIAKRRLNTSAVGYTPRA